MSQQASHIQELEGRIGELRESIVALESQLAAAREEAQHEAVERLESYIDAVDTKFSSVRSFFAALIADLRK